MDFESPLSTYLQTLAPSILERIYSQPSSCLAIFRLLPPLAQAYVMRTLFIQEPIPASIVNSWIDLRKYTKRKAQTLHHQSLALLRKLNIMMERNGGMFVVTEIFQSRLYAVLCCIPSVLSFGEKKDPVDKDRMTTQELDKFAAERWETVLHFMVGTALDSRSISESVLSVLHRSGLMAKMYPFVEHVDTRNDQSKHLDGNLRITNKGFQFLLQDVNTQIWSLLLQFAEMHDQLEMDLGQVLNFFFFLGSLEYGKSYSTAHCTDNQIRLLQALYGFGIVYHRKKSSDTFYPTKYAAVLNTSRSIAESTTARKEDSFVIVETNYSVYAYTDSPLQISVLGLFTQFKSRFPTFIVGMITRESVRRALMDGITAKQIVHFLRSHAHPLLKAQNPVIPSTVVDQITLWELERNRLDISDGFLYKDFAAEDEYQASLAYAKELGVLLWESTDVQNRMIFVTAEGHNAVKAFVKSLIAARE